MSQKLAVGILASAAPRILAQSLSYWNIESVRIYIHVDAKTDIAPFRLAEPQDNVVFIEDRHRVFWGGFSIVDAELALIKAALIDGFNTFILISDDTIPLVPISRVFERLADPGSRQKLTPTDNRAVWQRYRGYYCADLGPANPRNRTDTFHKDDSSTLLGLYKIMQTGKYPIRDLFWSPNWKALSYEDALKIVELAYENGAIYKSFRYTMNADEHYIQTELGLGANGYTIFRNFIWADFSRDPKPYIIRSEDDLQQPIQGDFLFARKIHDEALAARAIKRVS